MTTTSSVDLEYLESKSNWQCTVRIVRRDSFDCAMRGIVGYYWHTPDYDGAFAWGATRTFDQRMFDRAINDGLIELVKGELPI